MVQAGITPGALILIQMTFISAFMAFVLLAATKLPLMTSGVSTTQAIDFALAKRKAGFMLTSTKATAQAVAVERLFLTTCLTSRLVLPVEH